MNEVREVHAWKVQTNRIVVPFRMIAKSCGEGGPSSFDLLADALVWIPVMVGSLLQTVAQHNDFGLSENSQYCEPSHSHAP